VATMSRPDAESRPEQLFHQNHQLVIFSSHETRNHHHTR
jgi:hypothetical protein